MGRHLLLALLLVPSLYAGPTVVVAEGERFTPGKAPAEGKGWKVTAQEDSYASHTYGGMWMTHGGCLGAPADSKDAVATQTIQIPAAGTYRVWSKYQAPPYFNYLHRIEIRQGGKVVYSSVYGKAGTPRLWSFSGVSDELWWYWGMDHDAAEAPKTLVDLVAGSAEVRLITVENPEPAGARFVDFVVLTTETGDTYDGFKPMRVGTPFANEALATSKLWMRFQNTGPTAAQLTVARSGHFQPNYGGATEKFPARPTPAGQWSEWFDIGPFCRLVHDEGLTLTLPGGKVFAVQVAREPRTGSGDREAVGDMKVASGDAISVPIDITWRKGVTVQPSKALAAGLVAASKTWRRSNAGKKPSKVRFYGAFAGNEPWVAQLKDALGYNTNLPAEYTQVRPAFVAQHFGSEEALRGLHARMTPAERDNLHVISFGDEIGLGNVNFKDPKYLAAFRAWLVEKRIAPADLGMPVDRVTGVESPRLAWFADRYSNEKQFESYRKLTTLAKSLFGERVLTGANYSPHHLALYYGSLPQWVDIFRAKGMSLFWAEDYIFSVPEVPAILSFELAQMRCAIKYHQQPIHFYVMPHAPGQVPEFLRRNLLLALGNGAAHIDHFWVAPPERFTENYVSWQARDTYRVLSETMFDTGEIESIQSKGRVRGARVGVILSRATDFHEGRLKRDRKDDPFLSRCQNADAQVNQILCRKEQQYLYLALRQAGHAVDLITEDDIAEGRLKGYDLACFAGEWIERRTVKELDAWVRGGGVLYACAGLGQRNEFDEPDAGLANLLGVTVKETRKSLIAPRTLLELPVAKPMDTLSLTGTKVPMFGLRQALEAKTGTNVLGTWTDGTAAATVRTLGKGQAFAVASLPGMAWLQSGLRQIPYARGGRGVVYNPEKFAPGASQLVRLGLEGAKPARAVKTSVEGIEAVVIDGAEGSLVTLVNWTNGELKDLKLEVQVPFTPKQVWSVTQGKAVSASTTKGRVTFEMALKEGDFVLLKK